MRKIILSIALLVIVILIFGPLAAGLLYKKNVRDFISFYNSEGFHMTLLNYQRNWFTSDMILAVSLDKNYLNKFFENDTANDFPSLIIKQHIRNGMDFGTWHFPEIIIKARDEPDIDMHDLTVKYSSNRDSQFVNADAFMTIQAIQLEDQIMGPISMQLQLKKLNVSAIQDLIMAYHDFIREGQLYQGQLREKFSLILPSILADSSIRFEWKVPKKSVNDFIYFVSTQPEYVRDVAEPDHNLLVDVRNQMEFAMHRNEIFIDYLSDNGYVSNLTAESLIDMQKDLIPMQEYAKAIRDLFLQGKIALVVSYQLCWQYAEVINSYQFLSDRVVQYQKNAQKQIQDIFTGFIKKGYVGEKDGQYFSVIQWSPKSFTSNGIEIP